MSMDCRSVQPRPFLVINPMILNYSKKYIFSTESNSLKLFFRLCNMRIYVDGFVDDNLHGATIYNKKIYKIEEIDANNSILLISNSEIDHLSGIAVCDNPVIINPLLVCSNIYIYGAGYMGKCLLDYLNKKNIRVKGFIDSNVKKINTSVSGVKVYGQEVLKLSKEDTSVIEAGKYYREMDSTVCKLNENIERFYIDTITWSDDMIWIDYNKSFDGVIFIDGDFSNKKVYLCGQDRDLVYRYFEVFKILDFEDICIAEWTEKCHDVCCIEDALLEEDYIIVFCDLIGKEDLRRMRDLGLERGKDFCDIRCNIWEKYQGIQMLDINLAYTRNMRGDIPGIAVFGDNRENDYKIAVLGGSTSTSGYYWFKSWPEILHEKYGRNNVTIFNGAVEGYTSAQELIKLMRDIVWLKPDLVLVYDGNNDVAREESYNIFEIPYMKTIMEYARGKVENEAGLDKYDIFCGVPFSKNVTEVWLKNIEYMHAVCEINNIKFLAFMQPMLFSKPRMVSPKEDIVSRKWSFRFSAYQGKVESQMREFRKRASDICRTHEYIYDLSHIFDDKDVYMDHCHVFENGNRVIADEIYQIIKGVI